MIMQNRWVTVDEMAHQLQIIRGSAYEIIHNRLACPHTAAHTVETLKKLTFEVLEHPLYSLDLTPSDSPVCST
jgi:hypothetical protein